MLVLTGSQVLFGSTTNREKSKLHRLNLAASALLCIVSIDAHTERGLLSWQIVTILWASSKALTACSTGSILFHIAEASYKACSRPPPPHLARGVAFGVAIAFVLVIAETSVTMSRTRRGSGISAVFPALVAACAGLALRPLRRLRRQHKHTVRVLQMRSRATSSLQRRAPAVDQSIFDAIIQKLNRLVWAAAGVVLINAAACVCAGVIFAMHPSRQHAAFASARTPSLTTIIANFVLFVALAASLLWPIYYSWVRIRVRGSFGATQQATPRSRGVSRSRSRSRNISPKSTHSNLAALLHSKAFASLSSYSLSRVPRARHASSGSGLARIPVERDTHMMAPNAAAAAVGRIQMCKVKPGQYPCGSKAFGQHRPHSQSAPAPVGTTTQKEKKMSVNIHKLGHFQSPRASPVFAPLSIPSSTPRGVVSNETAASPTEAPSPLRLNPNGETRMVTMLHTPESNRLSAPLYSPRWVAGHSRVQTPLRPGARLRSRDRTIFQSSSAGGSDHTPDKKYNVHEDDQRVSCDAKQRKRLSTTTASDEAIQTPVTQHRGLPSPIPSATSPLQHNATTSPGRTWPRGRLTSSGSVCTPEAFSQHHSFGDLMTVSLVPAPDDRSTPAQQGTRAQRLSLSTRYHAGSFGDEIVEISLDAPVMQS